MARRTAKSKEGQVGGVITLGIETRDTLKELGYGS